ncbi:hypothetical protein OPU71_03590 [Niveibacterium sp. 24ML]|uniref:hypothetical protein n=1 Tax=Niveibacterium sp. 24ML TaxID=2985512 RepID=UPI0022709960|nr:hypothetical protein [Niveibacterium sp. 24ML]MCX9155201.1 hypothetical protein [Niveibacterium sp. 24ML]
MDQLTEALAINLRVEASRQAGFNVTKAANGCLHVDTPDGSLELGGDTARTIIRNANALWGLAGIVSQRSALLYYVADHLALSPPAH